MVWPIAASHVAEIVKQSKAQIIVIDAALLLEAGWGENVHQVWTVFVPREEAIKRICARDNVPIEKVCRCRYVCSTKIFFRNLRLAKELTINSRIRFELRKAMLCSAHFGIIRKRKDKCRWRWTEFDLNSCQS